MPFKQALLPDVGKVRIYKHRYARSLKITITSQDFVRVTMPPWMPYRVGLEFAKSKSAWIQKHRQPLNFLEHNQPIGKAHHLQLTPRDDLMSVQAKTKGSELIVRYPATLDYTDAEVQTAARKLITRALRAQAQSLLPKRLDSLAQTHGFTYSDVNVRILKARWGSCNHLKQVTLNIYLMLLSWELIDYVLLHELTHTRVLHHGPTFWSEMEHILPDARRYRSELKKFQPTI